MKIHLLICVLLVALHLSVSFAQEVTFNSIQRSADSVLIGEWGEKEVMGPDRITSVSEPKYSGVSSVYRFVVKPGDKVGGWTGERAEFSGLHIGKQPLWESENSGTQYFAFSVYIPKDWKAPETSKGDKWGTLLQLHGPVHFLNSPPVSIDLIDHFAISVRGGNSDVLGDWHGKTYELQDGGKIHFDQWDDFVLMVKFARGEKGEVKLWRRLGGELTKVFELTGTPTLVFKPSIEAKMPTERQRMLVGIHYWKQGFYRSTSPNVTTTLYQTGLVRASTFEAAANAAFGKRE